MVLQTSVRLMLLHTESTCPESPQRPPLYAPLYPPLYTPPLPARLQAPRPLPPQDDSETWARHGGRLQSGSHSFTHSLTHSLTQSLVYEFTHSFTHSHIHSLVHSFTHSFVHSLIHSLIHSFYPSIGLQSGPHVPTTTQSNGPLIWPETETGGREGEHLHLHSNHLNGSVMSDDFESQLLLGRFADKLEANLILGHLARRAVLRCETDPPTHTYMISCVLIVC
jgi:hypothetical protein